MADQNYKELTIEVGGEKFPYERKIVPMKLGEKDASELNQEAEKVNEQIDVYCAWIAEIDYVRTKKKEELFSRLLDVRKEIIESKDEPNIKRVNILSEANFEIHRVHADIAKEQKFMIGRSRIDRFIKILVVAFYIVIIIALIVFGREADSGMTEMPIIGIPMSVFLWSAIGSVAAVLYRFYKRKIGALEQLELEVRWLFARPIVGIIMGMVSYLIIITGLFVFGSATPAGDEPKLFWVAAFLAGFSDKFWEGLIDPLLGNVPKTEE